MTLRKSKVYIVGAGFIENLIQKHFNLPDYDIMLNEEIGTSQWNAYLRVDIHMPAGKVEIDLSNPKFMLGFMLDTLCYDGVLDPGTYFIEVNW